MTKDPIYVTRPSLPPLAEFMPFLERIWASGILTNAGPFHQELEGKLAKHLGVPFISLFNNGTNALLVAVQALDLKGEVITTPFSFVATANAIVWNKLTPVFVDIDPTTMNLDPARIEEAITPSTSAILPVHCFGRPCDTKAIEQVARKHGLKVLYDAAHAFGVTESGRSVLNAGDLSVLSFHATKVFNTFEGGAIVSHTAEMKRKIDLLRNFGFVNETSVEVAGLNGKMSEVQAAFGLVQLGHVDAEIDRRAAVAARYDNALSKLKGLTVPKWPGGIRNNHSYYPVLVGDDYPLTRDALFTRLNHAGIFSRRYFYPLITDMEAYRTAAISRDGLGVASDVAARVLCLPMYANLGTEAQNRIIRLVAEASH